MSRRRLELRWPSTALALRRQFFAVRQMVAVPAHQGRVAGVFKQEFQRRRFDVAVAKDHVGFALVTSQYVSESRYISQNSWRKETATIKAVSNSHHITWNSHFRFGDGYHGWPVEPLGIVC